VAWLVMLLVFNVVAFWCFVYAVICGVFGEILFVWFTVKLLGHVVSDCRRRRSSTTRWGLA
jgi:hypothetical protein